MLLGWAAPRWAAIIADRHPDHAAATPLRRRHDRRPVLVQRGRDRRGPLVGAEGHTHLGVDDVVEDLGTGDVRDQRGDLTGPFRQPADQLGHPGPAQ